MVRMIMMAGAALALAATLSLPAAADEARLRQQIKVLDATPAGGTPEKKVLHEIGVLMQGLQAKPIPEEFHRRMARGETALGAASDKGGLKRAADEFRAATQAAPWRAEAYYNLGIVQDKAGLYDAAMRNLKIYLAATPDASDAAAVRKLVYQIEYRKEEAQAGRAKAVEAKAAKAKERQRQQDTKQRANEERRRAELLVTSILGRWQKKCGSGSDLVRFRSAGPGRVFFELWSSTTRPAFWAGKTEFVFEPAANRFVSTPAFGQDKFKTVLTIVDNNRISSAATGFGRTWNCMLHRTN